MSTTFVDGYNTFAKNAGVNFVMLEGKPSFDRIARIDDVARESIKNIHSLRYTKDGAVKGAGYADYYKSFKGDLAEVRHAESFNIDAARKGSDLRAVVPHSNKRNSTDIEIRRDYGQGAVVRRVQSKYSPESRRTSYYFKNGRYVAMKKLVPEGQASEIPNAVDRLECIDSNGNVISSRPLSNTDAEKQGRVLLSEDKISDKKDFDAMQDVNIADIFEAGLSAAVISVVLETAPTLISVIENAIRDGEVNAEDFKRVGFAALKGGSLGFVRGTVAAALEFVCSAGKLGKALKNADPTLMGAAVALTMNALQNATLMAFGQMTKREFANHCAQDLIITSSSLGVGMVIGEVAKGAVGKAFGKVIGKAFGPIFGALLQPALPVLGFMLGSFIGSVIGSFIYKTAYSCVISFCVDTGCTFFGLVEQDYTLPNDVLKEIGIQIFEYERFAPKKIAPKGFEPKRLEARVFTARSIDIVFLRRGVIGVNRVGYL